jgi:regulatory protein
LGAVSLALERLESRGYINDEEFARLWVTNRCRLKPKGAHALKGELREKGVDEEIIRSVLGDVDDMQSAWAAVASRLSRMKPAGKSEVDRREFDKKLLGFLSRRGFSWDVCRTICDRAWKEQAKGDSSD